MEVRDAVEADAEALAAVGDAPADVMRNLVHDRTVRVAVETDDGAETVRGFVSFDARDTVHVTQLAGPAAVRERLLAEPVRFAASAGMAVELLVGVDDDRSRTAAESAGFDRAGRGPTFDGQETVRYRREP